VARVLDEDELIGNWTLVGDELEQLSGRRGATKLGFALLLRFYAVHGRFPAGLGEIRDQAVVHVARLLDTVGAAPAADLRLRHRHRDPRGRRRRPPAHRGRPAVRAAALPHVEACRQAARIIANATFTARQAALWGEGTTAVASDSTHFSAFDQNIFTEWHSRYRRAKRSVLIYWTVDVAGSMAVHSQLISCSASEVHAMVEGAMRHGTDMVVGQNFVDSHGASFVGFGITRLLDFDLIARFKQINTMKLYVPGRGDQYAYPCSRRHSGCTRTRHPPRVRESLGQDHSRRPREHPMTAAAAC
jgi:hypothetical protein